LRIFPFVPQTGQKIILPPDRPPRAIQQAFFRVLGQPLKTHTFLRISDKPPETQAFFHVVCGLLKTQTFPRVIGEPLKM
jgi:hypothetical protein